MIRGPGESGDLAACDSLLAMSKALYTVLRLLFFVGLTSAVLYTLEQYFRFRIVFGGVAKKRPRMALNDVILSVESRCIYDKLYSGRFLWAIL